MVSGGNYYEKLGGVVAKYRALVPDTGEAIDPSAIVQHHFDKGEFHLCQGELFQFEFLVQWLTDVRTTRPDVFDEFKARIYQCATADNHFGLRMELRIASALARINVPFVFQDRPDFSLYGGALGIECGSVWPDTNRREKDYRDRIGSIIRKKGQKRYATPNTLLAVEMTSVMAAMATHQAREQDTDFNEFLSELINATSFGGLLLFTTIYSYKTEILASAYARFESPRIDASLLEFMDNFFPKGDYKVYKTFVPGEKTMFSIYKITYHNVPRSGEGIIDLPLVPFGVFSINSNNL